MARNRGKWEYNKRLTASQIVTLHTTEQHDDQLRYILQHLELSIGQLTYIMLLHYLACDHHSPEIQAVIDAAKDLYKD